MSEIDTIDFDEARELAEALIAGRVVLSTGEAPHVKVCRALLELTSPLPADLAAIEARTNAATQGPWEVDRGAFQHDSVHYFVQTRDPIMPREGAPPCPKSIAWLCGALGEWRHNRAIDTYPRDTQIEADAAFIAAARTDVPALLAALRAANARAAELERAFGCCAVSEALARDGLAKSEAENDALYNALALAVERGDENARREEARATKAEAERDAARAEVERLRKLLGTLPELCESQAPDVPADTADEYRRGQKRAALDCATLVRRAAGGTP